jgi:hypothetical protein
LANAFCAHRLLWDAWDVEAPAMQQLPRGLPIFTLR